MAVGYKHHPEHQQTEVTHLAGDVKDRTPLIVEDMITTGGSILQAVDALIAHGSRSSSRNPDTLPRRLVPRLAIRSSSSSCRRRDCFCADASDVLRPG